MSAPADTEPTAFLAWAGPHLAWLFGVFGAVVAIVARASHLTSEVRAARDDTKALKADIARLETELMQIREILMRAPWGGCNARE